VSRERLAGKIAVVTGGASGIGLAIVTAFAREGARVVIADIDHEGAERAATACGGEVEAMRVDISDVDSVRSLAAALRAGYGRLDILHNNAAATGPAHQSGDGNVLTLDLATWDRTLAVDLTGSMLMCRELIPLMLPHGGSIINTTSNSGLRGDVGLTAYAAAKAGLNQLTQTIATGFGRQGIRCNAISPAHIASPSFLATVPPDVREALEANCLVPRLGTVDDVANAAVFLASDESSFITGEVLRVDGGALAHMPAFAQTEMTTPG
jgi:NAD(P)-dependent dehydrogenase (short-subunit alcohol dehydrogenase family)